MEQKTNVIITDSNESFRYLISDMLKREGNFGIVGTTGEGMVSRGTQPQMIIVSGLASEQIITMAENLGVNFFPQNDLSLQKEDVSLEDTVTEMIHEIGVPANIKGYQYLRDAILRVIENVDIINAVTKELYPEVAKQFCTTPSRVERAIRHAIEVAWNRGNVEVLQQYFRYTISNIKGRPTNSEFIALVADKLKMQLKSVEVA